MAYFVERFLRKGFGMKKKKICKIAGVVVTSAVMVAGGVFYGMHQFGGSGNSTNSSSPSLQSMMAQNMSTTANEHEVTLHFKWEGSQPHVAYSIDGTNIATTTPGVPMNDEGNGWYTYTIKNAEVASVVISVPELDYTTSEFSRSEGEYWYDQDTGWYTRTPSNYEEPEKKKAQNGDAEEEITADAADVAANSEITVHYPSDWENAYIYAWNALPDDIEMDWPGEKVKEDSDGYISYTFDSTTKVNFLFSGDGDQTDDYTIKSAGEYWYNDGKWVTEKPSDDPDKTKEPEKTEEPGATEDPDSTPRPGSTPVVDPDASDDFRDETIYFVITTRFYDGDSSNNFHNEGENSQTAEDDPSWRGDFKGLIEKLDYIKALGFSAIWITPVVENNSALDYHGYHAYNFSKVDPRYESSDVTYQDLINAAHNKGMKIIQDVVFNHTCNWGEENLMKITDPVYAGGRSDVVAKGKYDDPDNPIYHHNGFCGSNDYDEYTAQNKTIADDCFDLETENPTVYNYLVECYKKYINMGVDGFRVDTVKHISRLTLNSVFLPELKAEGGDSFYMFGEVCTKGHDVWYREHPPISTCFYTWKETGSWTTAWTDSWSQNEALVEQHYDAHISTSNQPTSDNAFLEGNNYHTPDYSQNSDLGVIDFQMHWSFDNANNAYSVALQGDQYFNDSTWNVVYVDSHDYGPDFCYDKRYTGGTDAWAENMALMFTFRGIPCIYYGSEIEFQAGLPIDKGGNAALADTGRAYFGDYLEGDVTATDFGEYTASGKVADTLNSTLSQQLTRLNKIRRAVPALRKGQYSTNGCSGNIAFKRRYTADGEDSFVCVAISGDATFSGIPGGTYVDLVTGTSQTVSEGGTLNASCSGRGNARVYVLQNDTATAYGADGKVGKDTPYLK